MKRTYETYISHNIPDYIIQLSDAIFNAKNFQIIVPDNNTEHIDDIEYLIDNLNILLDNQLVKEYIDNKNINFIYKYYRIRFYILLEYNQKKNIYKFTCKII